MRWNSQGISRCAWESCREALGSVSVKRFVPRAGPQRGWSRQGWRQPPSSEAADTCFGNSERRKGRRRRQKDKLALPFVLEPPSRKSCLTASWGWFRTWVIKISKTKYSLFKFTVSPSLPSACSARRFFPVSWRFLGSVLRRWVPRQQTQREPARPPQLLRRGRPAQPAGVPTGNTRSLLRHVISKL